MAIFPSVPGQGESAPKLMYKIGASGSSTHYLYESIHGRRLLLPTGTRRIPQALKIFIPNPVIRICSGLVQLLRSRKPVMLNTGLLEDCGLARISMDRLVVYVGSPGPYSKYTLLCLDECGHPESIVKLALTPAASSLVANEVTVLRELATMSDLNGHVPTVLDVFQTNNVSWVQQSVRIGLAWASRDIESALDFLRIMGKETEEFCSFLSSNFYSKLTTRLGRVRDTLSKDWRVRANAVLYRLVSEAPTTLRCVRAHRDFTKWNITNASGKPFVFDWEYSESGYPDAYDIFHYLLMPLATKGRLSSADLAESAQRLRQYRESEGNKFRNLRWQQMAYLFDVCLFYLESNGGVSDGDILVENYSRLLDSIMHTGAVQ